MVGVTTKTLNRLVAAGKFPQTVVVAGLGFPRFRTVEVIDWVNAQSRTGGPESEAASADHQRESAADGLALPAAPAEAHGECT
jgi:hypothetical protein